MAVSNDFDEADMFIGFHEDTLSSLVLLHTSNGDHGEVLQLCKDELVSMLLIE